MKKIFNIKILTSFLIFTSICFSSFALEKKNLNRENNLFVENVQKNKETENFIVEIKVNSKQKIDGPTLQIAKEAFCETLVKNFEKYSGYNIKKYLIDNEIISSEKNKIDDSFSIILAFNKNINNINDIIKEFKNFFNNKLNNKNSFKKFMNETKENVGKSFEKHRKNIKKEVEKTKDYYDKRNKEFNKATKSKTKQFIEDFNKFAKTASNYYLLFNPDNIKQPFKLKKNAMQFKKDSKNLKFNSKIFKLYEKNVVGEKIADVKNFTKKYVNVLNGVSKKKAINCLTEIEKLGVKLSKF